MQYNSDLKRILIKYRRMPAGTIEETMESVTSTNQPVFLFETKESVPDKAVEGHISTELRPNIRNMLVETKAFAKEVLKLKHDRKLKINFINALSE